MFELWMGRPTKDKSPSVPLNWNVVYNWSMLCFLKFIKFGGLHKLHISISSYNKAGIGKIKLFWVVTLTHKALSRSHLQNGSIEGYKAMNGAQMKIFIRNLVTFLRVYIFIIWELKHILSL